MSRKYFTLSEANRTLPLVRRIVADITDLFPRWRELVYRYEYAAAQARPETGETNEQRELHVQRLRAGARGFLRQERRAGDLLVLEDRRGKDRALARAGCRVRRETAGD